MSESPKIAFLFPGQGSQYPGMGKEICGEFIEARDVFDRADEALGFSLSKLCFDGPEEDLKLTANTQPAILTTSIAIHAVIQAQGVEADMLAGHSLGEYSALVAGAGLSLEDAVRLVRKRGQYMQDAVPVGVGSMAAIVGLATADVISVCKEAAQGQVVEPANLNGAGQIVIAGHTDAVERASILARERGARRALTLPVSAPFHCRLMQPAADRLTVDLEQIDFADLSRPLYANVDAEANRDGGRARDALVRQVSSSVLWEDTIQNMAASGVARFVEVGPGKVLSGLARKIVKGTQALAVGDPKSVHELLDLIRETQDV